MLRTKIRFASLTAVLLFAWIVLSPGHSASDGQEPVKKQEKGAKLMELQKQRLEAVRAMAKQDEARVKSGTGLPEDFLESTRMLA
jgi:hypothetical protein